jgi:hypothetical protein
MASASELQNRVDHLEGLLRERDRKEAEERAARAAAQQATDEAKTAAARAEAATAEREQIRRGAWTSHLIAATDPAAQVDFGEITIPKDGWPPGTNENQYVFTGGKLKKEDVIDVESTSLGKMLAALTLRI